MHKNLESLDKPVISVYLTTRGEDWITSANQPHVDNTSEWETGLQAWLEFIMELHMDFCLFIES